MFIIELSYTAPLKEIDAALPDHVEYLKKHYQCGKFIASGRKNPRTGGVILCRATCRQEAETLIASDPFHQKGLAEYEITEFTPTMTAEGLEDLKEPLKE